MIIRDYIIKEIIRTFAGVFLVLFLIILSTQLLKSLAAVANGKIPLDFLFALIGLKNLESMTLIIPLTLFLSILLALSRLYKDSEMVALSACGIGPLTLLKCVSIVVFTFLFIELGLSLVMSPWASSRIQINEEEFKAAADIELITPGQFNLSSDGTRVLYTEEMTGKTKLENVFLHVNNGDSSSVLSSNNANIVVDPRQGARYIVFENGNRYDGKPGSLDYRSVHFKNYGVLLEGKTVSNILLSKKAMSITQLLKKDSIHFKAEFQWRISQVLMMIVLALLAVPLSKSTPRQGRYGKMALAILIYIVYSNLLVVSMDWLKKGDIPPSFGMWWVHLLFFSLFIVLFSRQMGWLSGLSKQTKDVIHCPSEFDELVKD